MDDILQRNYYKSPLGYDSVDWFVNEVIKLENKTVFFSIEINKKDIIMTEKDEEYNRNIKICGFCEKNSNRLMLEINVT